MCRYFLVLISTFLLLLAPLGAESYCHSAKATNKIYLWGNVNGGNSVLPNGIADIPTTSNDGVDGKTASTTTFADLQSVAVHRVDTSITDSLGALHPISFFFFPTGLQNFGKIELTARAYVLSEHVDVANTTTGLPRHIGTATLSFHSNGTRSNQPTIAGMDIRDQIIWNNGADQTVNTDITFTITSTSAVTDVDHSFDGYTPVRDGTLGPFATYIDPGVKAVLSGNLNAAAPVIVNGKADIPTTSGAGVDGATASVTTHSDLRSVAAFDYSLTLRDLLNTQRPVTVYFFRTGQNHYNARIYANSEDVDSANPATGLPRLIGAIDLHFNSHGHRVNAPPAEGTDILADVLWTNGTQASYQFSFSPFTMLYTAPEICSLIDDQCPADTQKLSAGVCGCGTTDLNQDSDSEYDCNEECPADPNKIFAGQCGCGTADTDSNANGIIDCTEPSPPSSASPSVSSSPKPSLSVSPKPSASPNVSPSAAPIPSTPAPPSAPVITVLSKRIRVDLAPLAGATYLIQLKGNKITNKRFKTKSTIVYRRLSNGKYSVRYRVQTNEQDDPVKSPFSDWTSFRVNKKTKKLARAEVKKNKSRKNRSTTKR